MIGDTVKTMSLGSANSSKRLLASRSAAPKAIGSFDMQAKEMAAETVAAEEMLADVAFSEPDAGSAASGNNGQEQQMRENLNETAFFYPALTTDADGNVAFVYAYDPMLEVDGDAESMEYEFRFYMNKGRLVKGIVMQKGVGQQAFKEVWQGSKLPAKYVEKHDEYMAKAKKFPSIFVNIEKVSYNY